MQTNSEPDNVEWDALRRGDQTAWRTFFATYDRLIESVLAWSKWGFDFHTREELFQDIRAELTRTLFAFRGDCSLPGFIKRVCTNRCIDRIRRDVRTRGVMTSLTITDDEQETRDRDFPAGEEYNPVRRIELMERAVHLRTLLDGLDATCADAIRLFYESGLAYKDMAEKLGITVNTVGSRLAKCLEKLRHMARHDPIWREEVAARNDALVEGH